jgi:hypothetical protein
MALVKCPSALRWYWMPVIAGPPSIAPMHHPSPAAHAYDSQGRYIDGGTNARICGVRVAAEDTRAVIGIAAGAHKLTAIAAALKGRLINGLITDERTAIGLLD